MIRKSDAVSIFRATRGSRSIEISVPGAFTAVGFSGQQKKPGASAAERGRPSLFKTIDEDRRQRHDHINRSGRSTYPERISVLTSGATSPYNMQVNLLKSVLPAGARVGTVDKFQGQEAAVVLVSMTASSAEDVSQGLEFLYSRNRLNVAISRARCLAVVVASPRLLEASCSSI